MEENIYMLSDRDIYRKIGEKVKELRLRQNITQVSLAEQSQVSISTVKKIENGEIGSFDSLVRVLRILGELDIFSPLMRETEMSPNEYYEFMEKSKRKQRKRAKANKSITNIQDISEW